MYKSIETVLSGQFAFFKNPDVNTKERFFTFACIHKVALNGILGAIIGLNGYKEMEEGEIIPEFQRKLENLKVSITPSFKMSYCKYFLLSISFSHSLKKTL